MYYVFRKALFLRYIYDQLFFCWIGMRMPDLANVVSEGGEVSV